MQNWLNRLAISIIEVIGVPSVSKETIKGLFENEVVLGDDQSPVAKLEAKKLFHQAYQAQMENNYDDAIAECLEAIRVDEAFGNPYNDIGSYLLAKGDRYGCVRWFKRALLAPRYESYAFPHFNLARVYDMRHRNLDAAKHYGLALEENPGFTQATVALRKLQAKLN